MLAGLDQLYSAQIGNLRRRLRGQRLAVLTHAAAIDRRGRHLLTVLEELGATPQIVFTPEHGLFADAQAEEPVVLDASAPAAIDGGRVREHREPLAAQTAAEVSDLGAVELVEAGEHGGRGISRSTRRVGVALWLPVGTPRDLGLGLRLGCGPV